MASPFLARDLVEFNDEQLDRYLEENGRVIRVKDSDNLPASFLQRLRDRCDPERDTVPSKSVDLDQVAAKLEASLTRSGRRRIATPESGMSLDEEDWFEKRIQWAEDAYEELVGDGGRPLFHIEKLRTIAENPESYVDLLRQTTDTDDENYQAKWWTVLDSQDSWWKNFRFKQEKYRRSAETFAKFDDAARKRRNLIGLTQPFAFSMDASSQNRLTTWIEYVDQIVGYYTSAGKKLSRFQKERHLPQARYLNWVLDQIPLIEEEMAREDSEKAGSTAAVYKTSTPAVPISPPPVTGKRQRDEDEDTRLADQRGRAAISKRARVSPTPEPRLTTLPSPPTRKTTTTGTADTVTRSRRASSGKTPARLPDAAATADISQPRRSSRIAARQPKLPDPVSVKAVGRRRPPSLAVSKRDGTAKRKAAGSASSSGASKRPTGAKKETKVGRSTDTKTQRPARRSRRRGREASVN